jgi:hypothetical protein
LSGTVLDAVADAGIPHALVSYDGPASGFRFTDTGGSFQVPDVPCSQYSLNVSKPGFLSEKDLSLQFGGLFNPTGVGAPGSETAEQSRRPVQSAFFTVDAEPYSAPARLLLVPLSSIGGIVLDEYAEPLSGVAVECMAVRASSDGPDYVPARTSHTNDRGGYAFLDLAPGDYVVRLAGEVSSTHYFIGSKLNLNNDHRGVQPVYYPGGDSPATASVLHVGPGGRVTADFRQATEPAFDIDGRLAGFSPNSWTQIQLYREGDRLPLGLTFVNILTGQFRVVDVPRASYSLRAVQYRADPAKWMAAEAQVVVSAEPIRNLAIELLAGVDIPVSVSYEAGAQSNGVFQLMLQPQHTRSNARHLSIGNAPKPQVLPESATEPAAEPSQGKVFTDVIPDQYRLAVQPMSNGGDYVAAAKLGDRDVLHGEFPISGVAGLELQVTIRGGSADVEGKVTFRGEPAAEATVYLVPATGAAGGLKSAPCDAEGSYRIEGVAPGDYQIQAWSGPPSAADILSSSGEKLTLQPGERRTHSMEAASGGGQWKLGGAPLE